MRTPVPLDMYTIATYELPLNPARDIPTAFLDSIDEVMMRHGMDFARKPIHERGIQAGYEIVQSASNDQAIADYAFRVAVPQEGNFLQCEFKVQRHADRDRGDRIVDSMQLALAVYTSTYNKTFGRTDY